MIVALVLGIFFLVVAGVTSTSLNYLAVRDNGRSEQLQAARTAVVRDVLRYQQETGNLPSSLSQLASYSYAGGYPYAHLRSYLATANGGTYQGTKDRVWVTCQGYTSSVGAPCQASSTVSTFGDGTYIYARAAVVAQYNNSDSTASFLTGTNTCGTGNFADTSVTGSYAGWCGDPSVAAWGKVETHDTLGKRWADAVLRMQGTGAKLMNAYGASAAAYPGSAAGVTLWSLAAVVGSSTTGSGSPGSCTGTFSISAASVPLECGDLYDVFGYPVLITNSSGKVILTSGTPYYLTGASQLNATFEII